MTEAYLIEREIGIDAGHRIAHHGSKCRNPHGHRYRILAAAQGELIASGEQRGMVTDFSFLKLVMVEEIELPCDHGFILDVEDRELLARLTPYETPVSHFYEAAAARVRADGFYCVDGAHGWKLYLVGFPPTAEHLARHWYLRLKPRVHQISGGSARLVAVRVYETPNCSAVYGEAVE